MLQTLTNPTGCSPRRKIACSLPSPHSGRSLHQIKACRQTTRSYLQETQSQQTKQAYACRPLPLKQSFPASAVQANAVCYPRARRCVLTLQALEALTFKEPSDCARSAATSSSESCSTMLSISSVKARPGSSF